jgi:hypothetical protein
VSENIHLFASEAMPAIKALTVRDYRGFELPKVAAERTVPSSGHRGRGSKRGE